ncbi:hypothetical protein [Pedobacter nutrimenti]|uniref:hypothetical protein n=1 Tax=Pedobacter nutrimenti TaxID=1241337 RepID=UPI002930BCB6|nr:hypothetical protein [Pedobacter nutrimenti]
MKAKIFSRDRCIGTTNLHVGDESMGGLYGNFLPTEAYYKYVQKAVWKFWSAGKPDYDQWEALKLSVQLENGCFLFAAGGFTLHDLKERSDEVKRIDIAGVDRYVLEDFFLEKEPRSFLEEPWEPVSIEEKLAYEKEVKKEVGVYRSFFGFYSLWPNEHVLVGFELLALGFDQRSHDVLFVTRKEGDSREFAVVHLTWKGAKEVKGFPQVEFYKSFEEFRSSRMYPDKGD